MPFKGMRHGNGEADVAVAKLLRSWQHVSALWRHGWGYSNFWKFQRRLSIHCWYIATNVHDILCITFLVEYINKIYALYMLIAHSYSSFEPIIHHKFQLDGLILSCWIISWQSLLIYLSILGLVKGAVETMLICILFWCTFVIKEVMFMAYQRQKPNFHCMSVSQI